MPSQIIPLAAPPRHVEIIDAEPAGSVADEEQSATVGDARRLVERVRRRTGFGMYLSTQLREEGRLAASIGDSAGAIRAYRHYLALRSAAEPRLRPDVQSMRRELVRLEN